MDARRDADTPRETPPLALSRCCPPTPSSSSPRARSSRSPARRSSTSTPSRTSRSGTQPISTTSSPPAPTSRISPSYLELEEALFAELKSEVYDRIEESERSSFNRYTRRQPVRPGYLDAELEPDLRTRQTGRHLRRAPAARLFGQSLQPARLRRDDARRRRPCDRPAHSRPRHRAERAEIHRRRRHDRRRPAGDEAPQIGDGRPADLRHRLFQRRRARRSTTSSKPIEDATLPVPAGLVLMSPEIGISRAAAYASWQAKVGDLLGLDKLAWSSVLPEFDPFKYNSFAVNAGEQAYLMTREAAHPARPACAGRAARRGRADPRLPVRGRRDGARQRRRHRPVRPAAVRQAASHELVIFDVNRFYEAQGLITKPIDLERLISGPQHGLCDRHRHQPRQRQLRCRAAQPPRRRGQRRPRPNSACPGRTMSIRSPTSRCPSRPTIRSTATIRNSENPGIRLGRLALHGENNTLSIPPTMMTRQRWNPFHAFMMAKIAEFVREHGGAPSQ